MKRIVLVVCLLITSLIASAGLNPYIKGKCYKV
ncbi:hypothetical protein AAIR98_001478 [Elusimicrobium simillimum]